MQKLINKTKYITNQTILNNSLAYSAISKFLSNFHNLPKAITDYDTIYIDVSIYAKSNYHTGIQRVIQEVILQILQDLSIKDKVKFISATKKIGYRAVSLTFDNQLLVFNSKLVTKFQPLIVPTSHDLFLGLDFCPNIIPVHLDTFIKWKLQGVSFVWILYDLLPVSNPEWFTPNIQKNFIPWLKGISLVADRILCISRTVEKEMRLFLQDYNSQPNLNTIRLGQGFSTDNSLSTIVKLPTLPKRYVLMVGTLEPRKGHDAIIQAFNHLWNRGYHTFGLVLVGKQGWLVDSLTKDIYANNYYNDRLIWLENITDKALKTLYENSNGVIIASLNEGYGLPLIEALSFNKPVFARDIPVFHEITNRHSQVTFFDVDNRNLERNLEKWLGYLVSRKELSATLTQENTNIACDWKTTWEDIKLNIVQ